MFINEFNVSRSGDVVGILRFHEKGFSLPNHPELMESITQMVIRDHEVIFRPSGGTITVHIAPHDLTINVVLRAIKQRLKYTEFALNPRL